MITPRKTNPRVEYRLRQRDLVQSSPSLAEKYPQLKKLAVNLMFYDSTGVTKHQEIKCTLNPEHAKSALWFHCPGGECVGGDFDLSAVLATAVAERRKEHSGELRCQGERGRGDHARVACQSLLRYKLTLTYD